MDSIRIRLRINYACLIIGLFVTATAATSAWLWGRPSGVTPQAVAQICVAGIALTALIYASLNFHHIVDGSARDAISSGRQNALALISEWHAPDMAKLTVVNAKLRKEAKGKGIPETIALIRANPDNEAAVVATLNFLEKLGLMVAIDLAEEAILRRFFDTIIRVNYHAWAEFILYKRRELESEQVFADFEAVAKRWS